MVAKAVYAAAGPLERPTAAFVLAVAGVASNWASKVPVWEATALFCQAPALVRQLAAATVSAAVPLLPSLIAVMVAAPAATPVTRPVADTIASPGALDAHVTLRPVSGFPAESLVTAASCTVPPTCPLVVAGLTVTEATGAGGFDAAIARFDTVSLPTSA